MLISRVCLILRTERETATTSPESMYRLSIITVALNEELNIPRLKRSIDSLANPGAVDIETVLIDNGSNDSTAAIAQRCGFDLILDAKDATLPECRNLGLRRATGNWIAFVDADCELASDWLAKSQSFLKTEEPILIGWPARPPSPRTWMQHAWQIHWNQKSLEYEQVRGQSVVCRSAYRLICSANMAFTRAVADQLGGFNPELHTGEDTDFALRANAQGARVYGVPAMQVVHHGEPATLREFFRQQLWHMNRDAYVAAFRVSSHSEGMNALIFTLAFAIASLISIASLVTLLVTHNWLVAPLVLAWPASVLIPAARTCVRARCPQQIFAVSTVYFVYGAARLIKLLGICKAPRSWRVESS